MTTKSTRAVIRRGIRFVLKSDVSLGCAMPQHHPFDKTSLFNNFPSAVFIMLIKGTHCVLSYLSLWGMFSCEHLRKSQGVLLKSNKNAADYRVKFPKPQAFQYSCMNIIQKYFNCPHFFSYINITHAVVD